MADIKLSNVRIAFPKLFEAKKVGDGETKYYSVAGVIEPNSANAKALDAAMLEAATIKWEKKAADILKKLVDDGKVGFKKKPLTSGDGDVYDGFDGMWSVNASRREDKGAVLVLDRDKSPLNERSGKPYAGCYCNLLVSVWAQDNANGRRINIELKGVQFVKDGDAFGSSAPANPDAFDDLGAEEELV